MKNDVGIGKIEVKAHIFKWKGDSMCGCVISAYSEEYSAFRTCTNCFGYGIMPIPLEDVTWKKTNR